MKPTTIPYKSWYSSYLTFSFLLVASLMVLTGCGAPAYVTAPSQSSPSPTLTSTPSSMPEPSTPVKSPPITIALDYFGIRNTHWMSQVGGGTLTKIQLITVVSDEQGTLSVWPPQNVQNLTFDMDYFQVEALKDRMIPPVVFSGSATGTLAVYIAAYNISKGEVTKGQIDIISKWLGFPNFNKLKDAVQDKELVGYYWRTWSPSSDWGIGGNYEGDDGNLKVWLRIGDSQMPDPVQQPVFKPNVKIDGKLPTSVQARSAFVYNASDFTFTLTNNESFEFPIHWRLETTSNPGTKINYRIYPTEGKESVPANSTITVTAKYWFTTPGDYKWKYVAEYPKGNPVASWEGTLRVNP